MNWGSSNLEVLSLPTLCLSLPQRGRFFSYRLFLLAKAESRKADPLERSRSWCDVWWSWCMMDHDEDLSYIPKKRYKKLQRWIKAFFSFILLDFYLCTMYITCQRNDSSLEMTRVPLQAVQSTKPSHSSLPSSLFFYCGRVNDGKKTWNHESKTFYSTVFFLLWVDLPVTYTIIDSRRWQRHGYGSYCCTCSS